MKRFMIGFLTVMALWAWLLSSPSQAQMMQLETAMQGLYPVASGECDIESADMKVTGPCDIARKEGDTEHIYIVTPDNRGNPKLILEGTIVNGEAQWRLVYRKGEQAT